MKGSMGKMILIALIIIIVMLTAGGVYFVMASKSHPAAEGKQLELGPVFETEEFTVNISDQSKRYIKAKFALELSNEKVSKELEEKLPLVKDACIIVLSKQTLEELSTPAGKERLKATLMEEINKFLEGGTVTRVYFEELLLS